MARLGRHCYDDRSGVDADIESVRDTLVAAARRAGSPDPEDAAHNVFVSLLKRGVPLAQTRPFWTVSARNEARAQQRIAQREQRRALRYATQARSEEASERSGSCRRLLHRIFGVSSRHELRWLLRYTRGCRRKRAASPPRDRVRAHRLRRRIRRAIGKEGTDESQ